MTAQAPRPSLVTRLLSIADEPEDSDDRRLRKRVIIVAAAVLTIAPLQLPILAAGHPLSWVVAVTMPMIGVMNLVVLARTRRFDRFVVGLVVIVLVFPAFIEIALGGIGGASATMVFAFLGPVFALIGLGPHRALAWFVAFAAVLVGVVLLDPIVSRTIPPQPYPIRLLWYVANLLVPLGITFAVLRYTDIRRGLAEARSQELLTNAIPSSIAARLRRGEERIAEHYPDISVLFADLAGFTPWTRATEPARVVTILDEVFTAFDRAAEVHGVEKIKTIGDAYMAAAGAPIGRADHAVAIIRLALDMQAILRDAFRRHDLPLRLRIGIASGPAIGGVIGQRRILFDLWGDTVNTAARMQSDGLPGRIQVSPATRDRAADAFAFSQRAEIDVKGIGPMVTYLLEDAAD
jgi:adenylate cyclase